MQSNSLATLCPVCGQVNSCMQMSPTEAQDSACVSTTCWCFSEKLTAQASTQLKKLTDNNRCLCQSCLQKLNKASS